MIRTTVALPVWNSKDIAFVAMEGLIRQQGCSVQKGKKKNPYEWELIIAEENINSFCGEDFFMQYKDRLKNAGCSRLVYIKLDEWLPLPKKWRLIAQNASSTSEYFILQAADCYPEPERIKNTIITFDETNADWVQAKKGLFYWIDTGITVLYNGAKLNRPHKTDLNMATRTKYVQIAEDDNRKAGIDHWLFIQANGGKRKLSEGKEQGVISVYNKLSDYRKGLDTHGLNNISKKRHLFFFDPNHQWSKTSMKAEDAVDPETWKRLKAMIRYTPEEAKRIFDEQDRICKKAVKTPVSLPKNNVYAFILDKIMENYNGSTNNLKHALISNLPYGIKYDIVDSGMTDQNGNKLIHVLIDKQYRVPETGYIKIRR